MGVIPDPPAEIAARVLAFARDHQIPLSRANELLYRLALALCENLGSDSPETLLAALEKRAANPQARKINDLNGASGAGPAPRATSPAPPPPAAPQAPLGQQALAPGTAPAGQWGGQWNGQPLPPEAEHGAAPGPLFADYATPAANQAPAVAQQAMPRPAPQPSQEDMAREKRRYPRVRVQLSGRGEHTDATGAAWYPFQAEIVDISMMGMKLLVPDRLNVYTGYTVNLTIPSVGVTAQGTIRHMKPAANRSGIMDLGLELNSMSRQDWLRWMQLMSQ